MINILAGIGAGTTLVLITLDAWLTYRLVKAMRDLIGAADLLDGQRKLVAEYKSKFDTELVAHTVTTKSLEAETALCSSVVKQRDAAQAKCRAYLARSLEGATEDDINAVLASLFAAPLVVVPPPGTRRSDSGPDRLIDPDSDL